MNIFFSFLTRHPFSSPRDPGFLQTMLPRIAPKIQRTRRSDSLRRGSIAFLIGTLVIASIYPSAFVSAAQAENAPVRQASTKAQKEKNWLDRSSVPGEVLVKFREQSIDLEKAGGIKKSRAFAAQKNFVVTDVMEDLNVSVLKTKEAESVEQMIDRLKNDPKIETVQPNFHYESRTINTDDIYRERLWGLDNTGQDVNGFPGTADADIDAPEAWAISEGSSNVIAAVIDTGVAYNHPDLLSNMWDGSNCKDENGDALGGCNHGYDYEDSDKTPLPTWSPHGTHISGTIAAVKNNGKGVIGVAPHAKIMALKTSLSTADNVKSINFAKQNGAKVINASWGLVWSDDCASVFDPLLYGAIQDFPGLFVVAAGNSAEEHNGTTQVNVPSDYGHTTGCWTGLPNVISVAATNSEDHRASFSDYGAQFVDVGAPGEDIYSTVFTEQTNTTTLAEENFQVVTPPAIPSGWTASGTGNTWGTETMNGSKVLSSTLTRLPYADNADANILSPVYDLHTANDPQHDPQMSFDIRCETERTNPFLTNDTDYLALEMSPDGTTFSEITRWNEYVLDDDANPNNTPPFTQVGGPIYSEFLTNTFQYRFRWITNGVDNNHEGCSVDNIIIKDSTHIIDDGSGESYDYMSGTSMATPHVVGLAALIWGYHPELTAVQVKNIILETGDVKSDLQGKTTTGRRINAANALAAFQLAGGFSADNVIPAMGGVGHTLDGSGGVDIQFRVKGWDAGRAVTLSNFEYSVDNGTTWNAPVNGDASGALGANWQNNNYAMGLNYDGPLYSFTINTKHPDIQGLANAYNDNVKIRFKVNDGATQSAFVETERFIIDNVVSSLLVTNPVSSVTTVNADTYTITGTTEANAKVSVEKIAPLPSGQTGITGWSQQLANGATDFSITVDLSQDVGNIFSVTAKDAFGNVTDGAQLTILEDSTAVSTAVVSVGTDTEPSYATNDTTPTITVVGEENMPCRWASDDLLYSQMPIDQALMVVGDHASVTLPDQGVDGEKTVHVACVDLVGNEQTLDHNLDIQFTLDTTPPEIVNLLVTPNPAKAGMVMVTFGIDDTGTGASLNTSTEAVVTVNGLRSSYAVIYNPPSPPPPDGLSLRDDPPPPPGESQPPPPSSGGGSSSGTSAILAWTGSFILLQDNEEATATILVSGIKDSAGNTIAPNTVVGTFTVDTLAPTATLSGTPANPDTSAIPSFDVTVGGVDVVYYKYKLDSGEWSEALDPATHITRSALTNGSHTLSVVAEDTIGNWQDAASATTYTWTVNDTTPPEIVGLTDDVAPTKTKIWDWDSSDPSAQFRFTVAQTDDIALGGEYRDIKTATQSDGTGTFFLYVQARDNNGNESPITKVSAVLDNTPPAITLNDDASMQVYQGTVYTDAGATALDSIDGDLTAKMVVTGSVDTTTVGTYTLHYAVADALGNSAEKTRAVEVLELKAEETVLTPEMTVTDAQSDIVVGDNYRDNAVVHIPADVNDAHVDVSALVETKDANTKSADLVGSLTIDTATNIGKVNVQLAAATEITAPTAWDGVINAPQSKVLSSVTVPQTDGRNSVAVAVIEVGANDIPLTLSKAARLVIAGQAGRRAGYTRGALFTPITAKCSADTQAIGDALPLEGDCMMNVGNDLVIWTKHFTRFVSYFMARASHIVENPAPESVGVAVVEGATTQAQNVTLTLTYGTDVIELAVSNFSDFRGASFTPASHRRTWTLEQGEGEKTVYAMFRNADGGTTIKSARITLLAPVVSSAGGAPSLVAAPVPVVVEAPQQTPPPPTGGPVVPSGRVLGVESTNVVAREKQRVASVDRRLSLRMKGKVLASSDTPDAVWYVDPLSLQKFYIADSATAFRALGKFGLGITNADLAKIPVSTDAATAPTPLARRLLGRILLQVESHGEAWYVNPEDGKRYYVPSGAEAYSLLQSLRKDLPPADFRKISVGDLG